MDLNANCKVGLGIFHAIRRLVCFVFALGTLSTPIAAICQECTSEPVAVGYRDFDFSGGDVTSEPTDGKVESKLWWNDGFWWGVLWDPISERFRVHRLDLVNQCWLSVGPDVDDRPRSSADALWDGQRLYVASHARLTHKSTHGPEDGRIYRYSYEPQSQSYSLDNGFPITVNDSRSETLVIAKDSSGQLWVTWTEDNKVMLNRTLGDDQSWGQSFVLPIQGNDIDSDDISSVIAFGGDRIGVMWSNQVDKRMYFAVHRDVQSDADWETREDALLDTNFVRIVDDHINLAAHKGVVLAATKTGLSDSTDPAIFLLKRDSEGVWSRHIFSRKAQDHTRPIVVVNSETDSVYVIAKAKTEPIKIFMKSTHVENPTFDEGLGAIFLESDSDLNMNNPTSTKQNLNSTTGLLVLAADRTSKHYLHNYGKLRLELIPPGPTEIVLDLVGELNVKAGIAESLHLETFNTDPNLSDIWDTLFAVAPPARSGGILTLQADQVVTWEEGTLTMGGIMKLDIQTVPNDPGVKKVKIKKAGKKDGTTAFVSGDGGVNPNLADGGWHEVKVKNMDDVTVTFGTEAVTGLLKELKVKLDENSTTAAPLVKDFKIDITGVTTAADVKKGTVASVIVTIPATTVTALATTGYNEKIDHKPEVLDGHTKAEFKRTKDDRTEGVDIASLSDGFNGQLKERIGPCSISAASASSPKLVVPPDEVTVQETKPEGYALEQNHPNPFNPSTTITFAASEASEVTLSIYNMRGQLVQTLYSSVISAGQHSRVWDGTDFRGAQVASGIYVYKLQAKGFVATKKLILIR
jgi:hypothetical protein